MRNILIVNKKQFGYHTDTYQYCRYLKNDFKITYIGFDKGAPKKKIHGIKVDYVKNYSNVIVRYIGLVLSIAKAIRTGNYDVVFFKYFPGTAIFRLLKPANTQYVFDIRTASVHQFKLKRLLLDYLLRMEAHMFEHISIISYSLAARLKLLDKDPLILPLGSEVIYEGEHKFDTVRLIYVGTLDGRNLNATIRGLAEFMKSNPNKLISYDIVGSSHLGMEKKLNSLVDELNLSDSVTLHGYIPHEHLTSLFEKCNTGVSFVPITDYFDCQPPTKTFEYLLSGMAVIATKTTENSKIINNENGLLIKDDAEAFHLGLEKIYNNFLGFNSDNIRDTAKQFTWKRIIQKRLYHFLKKITQSSK